MVLQWSCGVPVIVAGLYVLIRAWRVNLDAVKILCALLILSQICYCISRSIYLQALENHYIQN